MHTMTFSNAMFSFKCNSTYFTNGKINKLLKLMKSFTVFDYNNTISDLGSSTRLTDE